MNVLVKLLVICFLFSLKAFGTDDPYAIMEQRNLGRLREVVGRNPSFGAEPGPGGISPIHRAAIIGWKEGLELLLAGKADPNLLSGTGEAPLHFACEEGHADLVRVLLDHGAAIEGRDTAGMTPLHVAAKFGRLPVIEILLQRKADPQARDKEYRTPLHWLARMGKDVEEESSNFFLDFSLFGKAAQLLLDNGAEVNALDDLENSPLAYARKFSGPSMGFNAIYGILSRAGGKEEAKEIMGKDLPALFLAIEKGDLKSVSDILGRFPAYAGIRKGGNTPLHKAAWENRREIVTLLLDKGVDVDLKREGGTTALHDAAFRGNLEIAKLLLARGARIDGGNSEDTPLHAASTMNHTEVMALLLKKGADPNSCAPRGQPPLFTAAREGRVEAVELLLAHGAKAGQKDRHGNTPLSIARDFSQDEIVKILENRSPTSP